MALINNENKNLISHLINDMKGTLKVEEIEDFLHEFLSYSEEGKASTLCWDAECTP